MQTLNTSQYKFFSKYFLFFYLIFSSCFSQSILSKVKYQLESGIYLSTSNQTPFWLRSNQYGVLPLKSQFITMRGSAHKEYDSTNNKQNKPKRFSYGYGLSTVVNVGKANQIVLPEAYLKVRYGAFEFYGGRKKEVVGLVDTALTSGSYIWSGNALPMPKVQISIPNYTPIFGHGLISIKGVFAHGLFDDGIVKNFYLHQKWIYGRIGKPNWKIKFYAGFNHQVQWGGRPTTPYIEAQTGRFISNYGNDFRTYLKVVSGVSLNSKGNGQDLKGVPLNEAWNRAGNHLGTIDIATEINLKNINFLIYRQSIYEDGSLYYLNNITDGLLGFSINRKNITKGIAKFCFEYINTVNQGGTPEDRYDAIPQLRGNDNYFNNGIYFNGWTYNHKVLGTPLITPLNQIKKNIISEFNLDVPDSFIVNNRVRGYNISMSGSLLKMTFTTKFILTHNLGLYTSRFNAKQFSFLQQINYRVQKSTLTAKLAIDNGTLYANNLGCYFGISRSFF